MFTKKCPMCDTDIYYQSKNSLTYSIKKNSVCKKCKGELISKKLMGRPLSEEHKQKLSEIKKGTKLTESHKKNIGLSICGIKRSDESKKRYSDSKLGDKNPAKREEVREKIRNSIIEKHKSDSNYGVRISESLIKYFKNNTDYINFEELSDFKKFVLKVRKLTNKNKKILYENWDGVDYYDGEFIKNNFNLDYNDVNYPTIDHKIPVLIGFKNKYDIEYIGSLENLCYTKRKLNCEKYILTEEEFRG